MQTILSLCEAWELKTAVATCAALVFAFIGDNHIAYQIFFILTAIDFMTGTAVGVSQKELSSRKMFRTVYKFLLYSLLVISAHQMVRYSGNFTWIEDGVVSFIAATEFLSIVENVNKLGVPMPLWIKARLISVIEGKGKTV